MAAQRNDGRGYAPSSPMPRLDQLPADQKAVLQLLLKQRRSYDDIAGLLRLERRAVRERALRAVHALGSAGREDLPAGRRDELADYLLGQQDADQVAATRRYVASSPQARAWATTVAGELAPIAPAGLPELPEEPGPAPAPAAAQGDGAGEPAAAREQAAAREPAPAPAAPRGSRREEGGAGRRSSRLGGALLLLALLLILGVGGFLLLRDDGEPAADAEPAATQATTAAPEGGVEAQINLQPAREGSTALGVAQIVAAEGRRGLAVAGQNLRPGNYAIWLYTSRAEARLLGFAPEVTETGVLQGLLQSLPEDFTSFRELVVSRERVTDANRDDARTRPGAIVLRGRIDQQPAGG
jgi:hypothetical protein